ncbi:MAG: hypothetical protein R2764_21475 [Bacteroidales bacterium]
MIKLKVKLNKLFNLKNGGTYHDTSKIIKQLVSSFPSLVDRFFDGDLMDWNRSNFADEQSTLPAVNVKRK